MKYVKLTFGSAEDNTLVLPQLAAHQGEVRFTPQGSAIVVDYGSAAMTGTYTTGLITPERTYKVRGQASLLDTKLVFGNPEFARFTQDQLVDILLSALDRDTLFAPEDMPNPTEN